MNKLVHIMIDAAANYIVSGSMSATCRYSADLESKKAGITKSATLVFKFTSVQLTAILLKALRPQIIAWQNGFAREHYDVLEDGMTVNLDFKAPATMPVDHKAAVKAELATLDAEARKAYLAELMASCEASTDDETA